VPDERRLADLSRASDDLQEAARLRQPADQLGGLRPDERGSRFTHDAEYFYSTS
jgi:hypothetical protein